MDNIILSQIGSEEFAAYFNELKPAQKRAFIKANRCEISALRQPEILSFLCSNGFLGALKPLLSVGSEEQIMEAFKLLYGKSYRIQMRPTQKEEADILKFAAAKIEMVRFLREETMLFQEVDFCPVPLRKLIYANAPQEVLDYLFLYAIKHKIRIRRSSAFYLLGQASSDVIRSYAKRVGEFSGTVRSLSIQLLEPMLKRPDISKEEKNELVVLLFNRLPLKKGTLLAVREKFHLSIV